MPVIGAVAAKGGAAGDVDDSAPAVTLPEVEHGEPAEIRRRLSRERAGLEPAPADLGLVTPYESQVRWVMRSGDVLERELASRLGAARSRELRAKNGGWPGLRWNWAG